MSIKTLHLVFKNNHPNIFISFLSFATITFFLIYNLQLSKKTDDTNKTQILLACNLQCKYLLYFKNLQAMEEGDVEKYENTGGAGTNLCDPDCKDDYLDMNYASKH